MDIGLDLSSVLSIIDHQFFFRDNSENYWFAVGILSEIFLYAHCSVHQPGEAPLYLSEIIKQNTMVKRSICIEVLRILEDNRFHMPWLLSGTFKISGTAQILNVA